MMKINNILEQLMAYKDLTPSQMEKMITYCMTGQLTDAQIAAFLVLMRMKGETVEELTSAAQTMQKMAHRIDLGDDLVDIVGTGGDGKNTFNVSTASAFVAAAAGLRIAKHGSHATSSRSGSADLLITAGFELNLPDDLISQCIQQCHMAFLFGPHFHQALQHARKARQQLGIRTLFNLLGPLLNPAGARKQVIGVFSKDWLEPIARVLANLGSEHALVIHSHDGLDEISIAAPTDVVEYRQGSFKSWTLHPHDYGCSHQNLDPILVDSPAESLKIIEHVFAGEKGPARDMVLLNAAAALYCSNPLLTFSDAIKTSAEAIDSGQAGQRFIQLRNLTQQKAS